MVVRIKSAPVIHTDLFPEVSESSLKLPALESILVSDIQDLPAHTLSIAGFPSEPSCTFSTPRVRFKAHKLPIHWVAIAVAISIHVVLAFVLQAQFQPSLHKPEIEDVIPIQTYFIAHPPAKPSVIEPEPVESSAVTAEPVEVDPPPAVEHSEIVASMPEQIVQEQELIPEPEPKVHKNTEVETPAEANESTNLFDQYSILGGGTSKYIQKTQRGAVDALSEARAQTYQSKKGTVDIPDLKFEPKDYGIGKPKPLNMNCDSSLNKGIATLGGLLGGNVKCSKRNNFQQFIDKRTDKQPQAGNGP